uniref:UBA domain-containing protein n=1 Tax=Globodera pallida TaxID=36090 RepID=A0A183BT45_GLOPA
MDLETWSKSQAVKLNQQNAVVSQLAQMAPHRRNQLARDMANGNSTAANELVARLMRDLSATQHGMMAFPHLALMADPQLQTMPPTDPAMWAAMRTSPTGFSSSSTMSTMNELNSSTDLSPAASASPALQAELIPQSLRLQMAQQRQLLLNGGGLPPMANVFQPGTAFNAPGTFGQSNLGQFGFSSPFRSDRLQNLNSAQIPRNPFVSNGGDSSDVSRPNSLFTSSLPSGGTQTQITPFSQSFLSSNSAKSGVNNELERTLSDAAGVGRLASTGREPFRDVGSLSNGKGFVDDVTMDDTFGRRTAAAAGAHQREETKKTFRRWTGN